MRIAYVYLGADLGRTVGVTRKIVEQVSVWRRHGHDVRLFVQTYSPEGASRELVRDAGVDLALFADERIAGSGALWAARRRLRSVRELTAAVRAWAPALIYNRFSVSFDPLVRLTRDVPSVLEVNTDDLREWRRMLPLYKYLYHRATRARLLRSAAGIAFVTGELAARRHFRRHARAATVIGNGIALEGLAPPGAPPTRERPQLVFIGEPGFPWHGVDKVMQLAARCPDWDVSVVGYGAADVAGAVPPNVALHGYLTPEQATAMLADADAAVASLAFHRLGLSEACPLKLRQYLAQGIPTVISHHDPDFPQGAWFLLELPNTPDNVVAGIEDIRAFVRRVRGRRVGRDEIRHLDTAVKEARRLEFFERVLRDVGAPGARR